MVLPDLPHARSLSEDIRQFRRGIDLYAPF